MKKNLGANAGYLGNIAEAIVSSYTGLKLTFRHLWQAFQKRKPISISDSKYFDQKTGIVTLQYPFESFPVPDNGRYRLYNEIEDCIVCDLCAKICPVNCIDIEPVKATEEIGKTSDGTTKRIYAAKFDIDMAKCCYCGLCTTVCPTECLTMTKAYDYSETDVRNMVYHFTDLSPEEAEQKKIELAERQKTAKAKSARSSTQEVEDSLVKTHQQKQEVQGEKETAGEETKKIAPKIPFKPAIKSPVKKEEETKMNEQGGDTKHESLQGDAETMDSEKPKPKPFKPVIKPTIKREAPEQKSEVGSDGPDKQDEKPEASDAPAKPIPFKPVIKPIIKKEIPEQKSEVGSDGPGKKEEKPEASDGPVKPKPFKPVIKLPSKKASPPGEEGSADPKPE